MLTTAFYAQLTTIANYNFNASTAYPVLPSATASNVISSGSSSDTFTVLPGTATGSGAFSTNSTAGNALAIANSSGANTRYFLFQLSGADLSLYQAYKLYFQPQRSSAGANLITVAYSTNGSTYTNFASTYPVSTAFTDVVVDLSAVTALNNVSTVYIKLLLSGATATTGTLRIDNFEVQANKAGSGGGSGGGGSGPWTVSGGNLNFTGNVGIGNANPLSPLDVNGNTNINGNLTTMPTKNIVAGGNLIGNSNLAVAGTANLNGDVVVAPTKSLIVDGFIVCNGDLKVGGTSALIGNVNIANTTKTLTVAGRANFNGDVATAAGKTVTVGGSLIDNGSLTVVGTTSLNGDVFTAANKTLTVAGRANFNGDVATAAGKTVTVGGSLIDNGNLTVVGTTSLNGDVFTATNKTLTVAGRANFNGDVATAANKTVTVGGSLINNGSLTVVGTTSLSGDVFTASNKTLTVAGRANFNGDVATAAGKTVTVGGSLIDNGSLTVVGTTSLSGDVFTAANKTLTVAGRANFNGDVATAAGKTVTVGGSLIDNGSLTVVGTTSLNGDVFTASNKTLTVAGRTNFNGDVVTATGKTVTVGGSLIDNGSLTVAGNTSLNGNVTTAANKTLTIGGTAKFNGILTATAGIDLGNGIGFRSYLSPTPGVGNIISLRASGGGGVGGGGNGQDPSPCIVSASSNMNAYQGNNWLNTNSNGIVTYKTMGANTAYFTQYVDYLNGNSYIDASGSINGPVSLYINQNCFSNTYINKAGGALFTGDNVYMNRNLEIGTSTSNSGYLKVFGFADVFSTNINSRTYAVVDNSTTGGGNFSFKVLGDGRTQINTTSTSDAFTIADATTNQVNFKVNKSGVTQIGSTSGIAAFLNVKGDLNTTSTNFETNHNVDYGYNTKITVNRNLTKAFAVVNNAVAPAGAESFVVYGNGVTLLNVSSPNLTDDVFIIRDALNTNPALAVNFKVKRNGVVYARELNVQLTSFPDYVFKTDYKLMSLDKLESYIKTNQHLPNLPTAKEIEKNGANLGELTKLQLEKIEELTLYIIELKKEMEAMKKRMDEKKI